MGSSTRRATLRATSSSRTARESAVLSTWRMIWTLRTDRPARSWRLRNACTTGTDRRLSWYFPSSGMRYSRIVISYSALLESVRRCEVGRQQLREVGGAARRLWGGGLPATYGR
jgi:hypothetical protein